MANKNKKTNKKSVRSKKVQKPKSKAPKRAAKTSPIRKAAKAKQKARPRVISSKLKLKRKQTAPLRQPKVSDVAAKLKETAAKLKEREATARKKVNINIPQQEEAKIAISKLLNNERAVEYLKKNVSKMAVDVVDMLATPKTDEFLAEQLGMKINAIRRILNIMQGYGITNYYISKNTKGWLSFAWYINTSKLSPFLDYVDGMEKEQSVINEKCNDYFMCDACYKTDKFLFTFDSAFENSFKCNNCGKNLNRMNREEVEVLITRK